MKLAAETGIAGLSIEDSPGDEADPLLLTGRSEGFVRGRPDIDETIRRLVA